jgi:predicted glycosyltransferase
MTRTPSLVFYDTENAKLQNAITYPFATRVIVPRCYRAWVPASHLRYIGYHELSYLHPTRFIPSMEIAAKNGLDPQRDNFFVRTVSWQANHDVGESGWNERLLTELVAFLSIRGKVHISSEAHLPPQLATYAYGGKVREAHHVMAHCRLFVGESATMASESAVLGVPAIYAAKTGRGYTDEEESRYGLVTNIRKLEWGLLRAAIEQMLGKPLDYWRQQRTQLLADTIDVAAYVADIIEQTGRGA